MIRINKQQLVLLTGMAIAVGVWWIFSDRSHSTQSFTEEFRNAYAAEVSPTNQVKEFSLIADENELKLINGMTTTVWSYNGQVPGPELRVQKGDKVRVNFSNQLEQPTTIHWHGVRVPNAMDGVPGVTQDPVQPGEKYVYEFIPKDTGTFWYHPHVRGSEQIERGLYGILVVEDPDDPTYNIDQVVVLDDWRLLSDGSIDPRFNTGHDLMHDGRWGSVVTANGQQDYTLEARPGERMRLRFVNTSNGRVYKLSFGGLSAQVIAVDGMTVGETFSAESFELAPGNRLDVDISLPLNSSAKSYRIVDTFTRNETAFTTITVSGDPVEHDSFPVPIASYFPRWERAAQEAIAQEYVLNARRGGRYGITWTLNGKSYSEAEPIILEAGIFQKVRFTNESARLHPMHLHGQFFKVVSRNGKVVNEPYWRDTVLIHPREQVDVAMVPFDKGTWANHCHILEHAEAGMMTMVKVE